MLGSSGAVSGTIAIASAVGPIFLGARGAMGFKDSMTIGCIWQELDGRTARSVYYLQRHLEERP